MGMCEGNCSQTILYVYRHTVAYTPSVYIKSRSVLITLMIQLLQRKTDSPLYLHEESPLSSYK